MIAVGIVASIAMLVISATAKIGTYRINFIFLLPLLWAAYWLRGVFPINPLTFAMYASALLFHDLGAYGFYQHSPLHYSFDIFVHFWFGVVVSFILRGALQRHFGMLRTWQLNVTTLLFMMGMGALHEIMEYGSYLLLGEEKGMLKPKTMYFFDTQRDLTNNLLGFLTALVLYWLFQRLSRAGVTEKK
jgi:uncharacterized membrane protein YjdF